MLLLKTIVVLFLSLNWLIQFLVHVHSLTPSLAHLLLLMSVVTLLSHKLSISKLSTGLLQCSVMTTNTTSLTNVTKKLNSFNLLLLTTVVKFLTHTLILLLGVTLATMVSHVFGLLQTNAVTAATGISISISRTLLLQLSLVNLKSRVLVMITWESS